MSTGAQGRQGEGGRWTLLEAALTRENLQAAWKRVKANKGAAGVDGLDIEQTGPVPDAPGRDIRQALLQGTYRPSPVRRVMIPKPDGSQRELGIPTVLDRLIQQALLQVLQPLIDPTFSEHSHGFRPGRRAHDAVKAAQAYVQSGKRVVVDVDLEKFFDRVNHDILIDRLGKRIDDAGVIRLIRAYLNAGIMDGGVVVERHLGTPQGGPLSPLLANVLLDEVDKALEARGHSFARYADDCNVYVGSIKAGRAGDGAAAAAVRRAEASDQRSQERGGQRLRAQVPGLRAVGGQGPRGQMCAWPTRPWTTSRPASGNSRAARAGAAWSKWCSGCGRTCWAGRPTSGWRKRPRSGASWTNGCAIACGRSSSSTGSGRTTIYRELKALGASDAVAKRVAANSRRWWRNSDRAAQHAC